MKPPRLNIPLSLTPSEASVLLQLIEEAMERQTGAFTLTRIKSLYIKLDCALRVNLALYGEPLNP